MFIYNMHEIVNKTALKEYYLNQSANQRIMESVIPQMTIFKLMLRIRDIDDKKKADTLKEAEK